MAAQVLLRAVSQAAASLLGVLVGLVAARALRSFGRLWCEPSGWEMKYLSSFDEYGESKEAPPEEAKDVTYSVGLDLFNGKEIPVGLRDVTIVFVCEGGKAFSKPRDATTGTRFSQYDAMTYTTLAVVNLPPRQWVHLTLQGGFGNKGDVRLLARWKRVEFVGQRQRRGLFEPKTYRKTIKQR